MEQLQREAEVLLDEELLAAAEEARAVGPRRAHVARSRQATSLEERVALRGEDEEGVLPEDGIIALERAQVVRVPPVAADVRPLVGRAGVPLVARPADAPAVRDGDERLGREDLGSGARAREAGRLLRRGDGRLGRRRLRRGGQGRGRAAARRGIVRRHEHRSREHRDQDARDEPPPVERHQSRRRATFPLGGPKARVR